MGLILDARGSHLLESIAYGKVERLVAEKDITLCGSARFSSEKPLSPSNALSFRSSVEGAGLKLVQMMITK